MIKSASNVVNFIFEINFRRDRPFMHAQIIKYLSVSNVIGGFGLIFNMINLSTTIKIILNAIEITCSHHSRALKITYNFISEL